jgi:glycosyltransferase involved in cell wall biosynthesis
MLLTVAGLRPRKGIHHLFGMMARLRDVPCTLVICGDGPERARLESLAAELGVAERVRFMGRVDRLTIPKYFAACDVFVLASIMEAAGNVLFEAMSCARPIVCTDAGGPGEYVADGETGFVVAVGDEDGLADRVARLLADHGLREAMGAEGRRRSVRDFDYDRMLSDILEVYREVVN